MTQIKCSSCLTEIEYSVTPPNFCSNCGFSLRVSNDDSQRTSPMDTPGSAPTRPQTSAVPDQVGEFRLLQELGRGGMGVVYEAEQLGTGRRVALKLLLRQSHYSPVTVERFVKEGRVAASLSHPKSTFVYAAGQDNEQFYIAMELMPGGTLKDVVDQQGRLSVPKAVDYILDVIDGLEAAHRIGVVHRDVKPSNCFLDQRGGVKVGDFGLSKSLVEDSALTRTGTFLGTPQFAAPEQIKSGHADQRTDIYAVAATLFYLVAGRVPFQGDLARVIADIASETAPKLGSLVPDVPKEFSRVLDEMLRKDPKQRPQNLADVRKRLLPFASGSSSIADLGRRMAAHFIDTTFVGFFAGMMLFFYVIIFTVSGGEPVVQADYMSTLAIIFIFCAYYAVAEGIWGQAVGKRLMGLRVIGPIGEAPGIFRASLRSIFIPGLTVFSPFLITMLIGENRFSLNAEGQNERIAALLLSQLVNFLAVGISLLFFVTIRRSNGWRGIHELLSGTRVVRINARTRWQHPPIPVTAALSLTDTYDRPSPQSIGGFTIVGKLYEDMRSGQSIQIARDEVLGRTVWLFNQPLDAPPMTAARKSVVRPTRLHWLQGGTNDRFRWDAFESVPGMPLVEMLNANDEWKWHHLRLCLASLAEELAAAAEDNTLPESLSLDQVWIDRDSNIKLLDQPLTASTSKVNSSDAIRQHAEQLVAGARAVKLFRETVQAAVLNRSVPEFTTDFVEKLAQRPGETELLTWAARELRNQPDRRAQLTWDERLGVMAISSGLELAIFTTFSFVLAAFAVWLQLGSALIIWFSVALITISLAAAAGYFTQGGLAFAIAGISVRSGKTRAGKLRCAARCLIAWFPGLIGYAAVGVVSSTQVINNPARSSDFQISLLLMLVAGGFLVMLHLLGALISVLSPERGVQDWLARTHLVPR